MSRRGREAPLAKPSPPRVRVPAVGRDPVVLAFAAIVAAFLGTRLALLWRFPPFLDEALYASWAWAVHDDGSERFISLANGKEPLLPWLGAVLMKLGAEPLTAVRVVSMASGAATVALVAVLGRRLGGAGVALASSGLYVVLPYFVVHDVIGIYEPLLAALAMLALYLQIRLAEQPRLDFALLLGISLGAGLLTKEAGLFALVLLPASLLCFPWRRPGLARRLLAWLSCVIVAVAIAGLLFSILKLSPLYAQLGSLKDMIEPKRSLHEALAHPLRWFSLMWPPERTNYLGYLTSPLVIVLAIGAGLALRTRTRLALLLGMWVVVPVLGITLIAENAFARYMLPTVPPLAVFMGFGLERLTRIARELLARLPRIAPPAAVGAATLALLVPAFVLDGRVLANPDRAHYPGTSDYEYGNGWAAGNAWRASARELQRLVGEGRAAVVYFEQGSSALELELRDDPHIAVLRGDSGTVQAANARFVIENGSPIPPEHGPGRLRLVWEYRRPRQGVPLKLYERGVVADGRFYSTAEGLRAGLGLPDREFDAYISSHPDVKAWYEGQAQARSG